MNEIEAGDWSAVGESAPKSTGAIWHSNSIINHRAKCGNSVMSRNFLLVDPVQPKRYPECPLFRRSWGQSGPHSSQAKSDASDPGCVKTRRSAKGRKYNSSTRYRAESAPDDLTS